MMHLIVFRYMMWNFFSFLLCRLLVKENLSDDDLSKVH